MIKVKKAWSLIFGISASEYSGFRLIVFTALVCSVGLALANHFTKSPYNNYDNDARVLDSLLAVMEEKVIEKKQLVTNQIELEIFDPNVASIEKLLQIGFPDWLANRLKNYRTAGGRFNQANDLLKLYDFPDSLYKQIANYVRIKPPVRDQSNFKDSAIAKHKIEKHHEKYVLPIFDLNSADTAVYQTIKGIGSKLSSRIVNYRNSLGGFIEDNQLYQVYGLDSSVVEKLLNKSLITDDFEPSKIEINLLNKEQLAVHPYINWNQAKLIIAYRNQHGPYNNRQELLEVYSINENWLKKIGPYLTF